MTTMSLPDEAAALVRQCLGDGWSAEPLLGDASVRAYYRIASADRRSYILCYYPPELRAQLRRFLAAYEAIAPLAHPPEVVGASEAAVLQRDVGDRTLFDLLHEDRDEGLRRYREAIDLLVDFQKAGATEINPPFTAEFFATELEMAREYFVEKLMNAPSPPRLVALLRTIADDVARHPYVLCHRDFHGENLHLIKNEIYLLDYQDMRMGPDTYDLASLLRDRAIARVIGLESELELVDYYAVRTGADAHLRRRYFEALLQRSIKILGTFSRQPIQRGKFHYLDFIPGTLESVRRCLGELEDYRELAEVFPMDFSLEAARSRAQELYAAR